jgi:esterase
MKNILLLHGAIGSSAQLQPLDEKLKEQFLVHLMNFSGHGGEAMPAKFSIPLFADDVLRYLDKNKIEKINIFGYSMGGYVALYLAKHYPNRVEKIFTLGTKFNWTPEIADKEIKMLDPDKIAEKIPAFAKVLEERHAPNDWKEVLRKTADMMVELGNHNTLDLSDYRMIEHRAVIALGDLDNMVTAEETKAVAANLKNAELVVLEETAHPIEKTSPGMIAEKLIVFLK